MMAVAWGFLQRRTVFSATSPPSPVLQFFRNEPSHQVSQQLQLLGYYKPRLKRPFGMANLQHEQEHSNHDER